MANKTPLYSAHIELGARMVDFAGWELPERYGAGVIAEHMAVRRKAGAFDVSHMGEAVLRGPDALKNMQRIFTNDFSLMQDGQALYTVMCNFSGGVLDDMIVFKLGAEAYYIVVNASNTASDIEWIKGHITGAAVLEDISGVTAMVAVQGPLAAHIISKLAGKLPPRRQTFVDGAEVAGIKCLISRTGYTGEDGFEIYCPAERAEQLWNNILQAGGDDITPCGLGARDTLRFEAAMPLYGHEMDAGVTPFETGLGFAVKMEKEDFIGKEALASAGKPSRKRIGLKITGRGIAREHQTVLKEGRPIGKTTSGTFCPHLGYSAAMALVGADEVKIGHKLEIDIRGRLTAAEAVKLPFYTRANL